jgi:hypothetical protein
MISQQVAATPMYTQTAIPYEIATAATRYQVYRELEAEQLAVMARQNLLVDWTLKSVRPFSRPASTSRMRVKARFREHIRAFVLECRSARAAASNASPYAIDATRPRANRRDPRGRRLARS